MADSLRTAFIDYCAEHQGYRRSTKRQSIIQQLTTLQLQLSLCHSAYECAKSYPDIGPLLITLAQSQVAVRDAEICQAVVSAAMEYSKAMYQGVYSNQKASLWLSRLVRTVTMNGSKECCTLVLPSFKISSDGVSGRRLALHQLASMIAEQKPERDPLKTKPLWSQAFSICHDACLPGLIGDLLPYMDAVGWDQLESHELLRQRGLDMLCQLPLNQALILWNRLEGARASLVLYLLRDGCINGRDRTGCDALAECSRIIRAVFADDVLARQMLQDFAHLVDITRDRRVAELWKELCRSNIETVLVHKKAFDGPTENIVDLFYEAVEQENGVAASGSRLEQQWGCVVQARQMDFQGMLATWLCIVALAKDDFASQVTKGLFGSCWQLLTPRQVVARDMAVEIAAFVRSPLANAAVAKSVVLQDVNKVTPHCSKNTPP